MATDSIPIEIWSIVIEILILSNRKDVFALRLTCKTLSTEAQHALDRHIYIRGVISGVLFIETLPSSTSPNPTLIQTLDITIIYGPKISPIFNAALRSMPNLKVLKIGGARLDGFQPVSLMEGVEFRLHTLWCDDWIITVPGLRLLQTGFASQIEDLRLHSFSQYLSLDHNGMRKMSLLPRLVCLQLLTLSRTAFQLVLDRKVTRLSYKYSIWDDTKQGKCRSDWIRTLHLQNFHSGDSCEFPNVRHLHLSSSVSP